MWTEALTWVKCTNPAGNHKSTWGLRPHKVTSMREESPEIWVSRQARDAGSENRKLLLIQTFSFSLLKAAVCIFNTCLNAGSWSPSPRPLLDHLQEQVIWRLLGWVKVTVTRGHDPGSLPRNITDPLMMEDLNPWPHTHFLWHVQWPRHNRGFPGGTSGQESTCQCSRHMRHGFSPWVGKISWRRAWQTTPVFLPGESHGQRSLEGYSPQGRTQSDMTEAT